MWLWLLTKNRTHAFLTALPGALLGLALVCYNQIWFGQITGVYKMEFGSTWADGLPGVLLSPVSGLLVYFPIAIFGFAGIWKAVRENWTSIYGVFAVFIGTSVLVIAKWSMWHGGHCFGPRLLSEIQPFLLLGCIPLAPAFTKLRVAVPGLVVLIWCVTVQTIGLTLFPASLWLDLPADVDFHKERRWDWRDNPLSRSLLVAWQNHVASDPAPLHEWKARYEVPENSLTLARGGTYSLNVKIKNRSREPWLRSIGYRSIYLGYRVLDADGTVVLRGKNRGLLGRTLAPGRSVTIALPIEVSLPPGFYVLECSLMQQSVASFTNKGVAPLRLPLVIP